MTQLRLLSIKEGEIVTMFEIPVGGNDFSKALANQFKIPFHEAENLKIQYGKFFSTADWRRRAN